MYEKLAPEFGYTTRPETREFDENSSNGKLMIAVCKEVVLEELDRAREEENKRCVDIINRIIQTSGEDSSNQWFDGLRSARESIKLTNK